MCANDLQPNYFDLAPYPERLFVFDNPQHADGGRLARKWCPMSSRLHPWQGSIPSAPDWVVVALPTVIAIRAFHPPTAITLTGLLVAVALLRKTSGSYLVRLGPLILLFVSSAIVLTRTAYLGRLVTFLLVSILVIRLIHTVDARKIVTSLIDGCGLYLVANVLLYVAGFHSTSSRIGGLALDDGGTRIIFPLSTALNTPPTIASVYIVGSLFLLAEQGWPRRTARGVCIIASIIVLLGSGSRQPILTAAIVLSVLVVAPFLGRWLVQVTTVLAATSAFILPNLIASAQFLVAPLAILTPTRASEMSTTASLNGRDYIWERSIRYWMQWVNDLPHIFLGYGVNGQFHSGASGTYSDRLAAIMRNPEYASLHNSFLQQLFDGGLCGWLLLTLAIYWAGTRLSKLLTLWNGIAFAAIGALTALIFGGMTEASLAPGAAQDTFWILLIIVGISCQMAVNNSADPIPATPSVGKSSSPRRSAKRL